LTCLKVWLLVPTKPRTYTSLPPGVMVTTLMGSLKRGLDMV